MTEDTAADGGPMDDAGRGTLSDVIPKPVETTPTDETFRLTEETAIRFDGGDARPIANYLADRLRPPTGFDLPVEQGADPSEAIALVLDDSAREGGEEAYDLTIGTAGIELRATAPPGLFAGVGTIRQLLPPEIESETVEHGPWPVPGGTIRDHPRFAYRGAHFDVARHFFPVEDIKRLIDHLARYKLNHLHLHLTDDQGWRLEIEGWPKLTEIGASTEVGGGEGGFYSVAEYEEIVAHAASRYVTIVPEIDMPGHTNAAQSAYGELTEDGEPKDPFTGTDVGFSAFPVDKEVTYEFVDDVLREVAALTPGPFVHIGGDEAHELTDEEFERFVDRVAPMVAAHGKRPIGWHQILAVDVPSETAGQYWSKGPEPPEYVLDAVAEGHELVLSPATRAYLDLKYDEDTELGLDWAGHLSVADAYDWDPGSYVESVDESSILGVESALWSETLETMDDVEFLLYPRIAAIAERGWSQAERADWDGFRERLGAEAPRWNAAGINYYRSPDIPWADAPR